MWKTQQQQPALPEPDVWWGESGIDALLWAEGQPYAWRSPRDLTVNSVTHQDQNGASACRSHSEQAPNA